MTPDSAEPSSQVVLWIDDDLEFFDVASKNLELYGIRTEHLPELMILGEGMFPHSRHGEPWLLFVGMRHVPEAEELRRVFEKTPIRGVISDLKIGEDQLGGIAILSAAALSPYKPKLALFSGEINESALRIAKSLGVEHILSKKEGPRAIESILIQWFDIRPKRELSHELESLRYRLNELSRENTRLKNERSKFKKEIKSLSIQQSHKSGKSLKGQQVLSKGVPDLRERVNILETERQVILAHQHDLVNTSSLAIQALEQLCADKKLLPPVVLEDLERIRIASKHCDVLIQSLGSLAAKLTSKKTEPSSLEHALSESRQILSRKIPDNVIVDVQQPKHLPLCSIPEPLMVRCILNLLLNSIEALPKGGRIGVMIRPLDRKTRTIRLQVIDTGRGIKKPDLQRVFDPTFSTKGKKLGLGLFIVKKVITDFGGQVSIRSQRGKGTNVSLRIPQA